MKTTEGCTCARDGWPCEDCQQRFYRRSYQIRIPYQADRWHLLLLLSFLVFMSPAEAHLFLGSCLAVYWFLLVRRLGRRRNA